MAELEVVKMQVPDVSAVIHTSDFPCIKERRDVPDTEWRDNKQEVGSRHPM